VATSIRATFTPYALLNDDTTDVGAVHLGIVVLAEAAGRPVQVRETHKLSGAFASPAEVAAGIDQLETWSRIVFDALEASTVTGRAS
jgi:predicted NUDIX family phosphoesterase